MDESRASTLHAALICPDCHGALEAHEAHDDVTCTGCDRRFPRAAGGVPVLLPVDSAFQPDKIAAGTDNYYANRATESQRKQRFRRRLPGLATDLQAGAADDTVNALLGQRSEARHDGLVVGAGFRVEEYSKRFGSVDWLVTDTEATFGASVVGDVTSLPVADASMDFVLCEHVLEHVLDPLAAGREIERVLRPGGIALVKLPFNYPWHGGFIDFYRFTPAGYLAAFRRLEALHIGHGPGPASTVTYALQSAWVSLFTKGRARRVAVGVGRLLIGPWRKLDRILVTKRGSLGTACSLIFIGRRTDVVRSATEVVAQAKALGIAPVLSPADRTYPSP